MKNSPAVSPAIFRRQAVRSLATLITCIVVLALQSLTAAEVDQKKEPTLEEQLSNLIHEGKLDQLKELVCQTLQVRRRRQTAQRIISRRGVGYHDERFVWD
jgi:hypothetical protein